MSKKKKSVKKSKSAPLRYVMVGLGDFGGYWCAEVLPRLKTLGKAEAVGVVDLDVRRFGQAVEHLGVSKSECFTDLGKALDQVDADFVVNITPPAVHEAVVDAALAHDLHILSEKPLADTIEGCCRIYQKVSAAGRKMAVTMSHRFDRDKQSLEAAIRRKRKYGPMHYLVGRFTANCRNFGDFGDFRHRMLHPLLIDGAVHHFDIIRALTGADAKTVYAVTWNPKWGEYAGDTAALVTLEMTNGVKVHWEGSLTNASCLNGWCADYFRAECRDATLELDQRWLREIRGATYEKPLATDLPLLPEQEVWMNPWLAEMFCDWVSGRRDDHPTAVGDNIQNAALLYAAVASAECGEPIDVQAFLQGHLKREAIVS